MFIPRILAWHLRVDTMYDTKTVRYTVFLGNVSQSRIIRRYHILAKINKLLHIKCNPTGYILRRTKFQL